MLLSLNLTYNYNAITTITTITTITNSIHYKGSFECHPVHLGVELSSLFLFKQGLKDVAKEKNQKSFEEMKAESLK